MLKRVFVRGALLFAALAIGAAQASPPPPPPPPLPPPSGPVDVCGERGALLYMNSYLFEIRPCTIVATPQGRKVELSSTGGPKSFADTKGSPRRPVKVVFRSFMPGARTGGSIPVKQTGRTLRVRLPNREPSVLRPYTVTLPATICNEDYWLLSVLLTDGTETNPFGVINSMCGPIARNRR